MPRAGRSDIIAALTRALDPMSTRSQPRLYDLWQSAADAPTQEDVPGDANSSKDAATQDTSLVRADFAEVEVTLGNLGRDLEQACDGFLEPQGPDGQPSDQLDSDAEAEFCVRITYRVAYDAPTDTLDHFVYFPLTSNPAAGDFARVPIRTRRLMPVVIVGDSRPLQVRVEGTLRKLLQTKDAQATTDALSRFKDAIDAATSDLALEPVVAATLDALLVAGAAGRHLSEELLTSSEVTFRAEDGSLAGLLRAIQPALNLDDAGTLTLQCHGSTVEAVLAVAEALLATEPPGTVVAIADDFGDGLDTASAEHLAGALRCSSSQAWISTRRAEVARAFDPSELLRLTRHEGIRAFHAIQPPVDRKELASLRLLHSQLLPALTCRTLVLVEGPHDLTVFTLADRRRPPGGVPLSANGIRVVSADSGMGGGTGQVERAAHLARQLGFRVIAFIDGSSKWEGDGQFRIAAETDVLIRLPAGYAIERALTSGVDALALRDVAETVFATYGLLDSLGTPSDDDLESAVVSLLHRTGIHGPFLEGLLSEIGMPALIGKALDAMAAAASRNTSSASVLLDAPVSNS
jgi:putative ATP-dependent endonuclease of OLD family